MIEPKSQPVLFTLLHRLLYFPAMQFSTSI